MLLSISTFGVASHAREGLFLMGMQISLDNNVCLLYIHSMKRISMFLSEVQLAALRKLAKRSGLKVSELVRRFIDEGLKRT
jgi:hypothetical protein